MVKNKLNNIHGRYQIVVFYCNDVFFVLSNNVIVPLDGHRFFEEN